MNMPTVWLGTPIRVFTNYDTCKLMLQPCCSCMQLSIYYGRVHTKKAGDYAPYKLAKFRWLALLTRLCHYYQLRVSYKILFWGKGGKYDRGSWGAQPHRCWRVYRLFIQAEILVENDVEICCVPCWHLFCIMIHKSGIMQSFVQKGVMWVYN